MSRSLDHLHPAFRTHVNEFLKRCELAGHDILVTCTYRSNAEQTDLYAIGRTVPGNKCRCGGRINGIGSCAKHPLGLRVTNAKPGESKHNNRVETIHHGARVSRPASFAVDIVPMRYGKPVWGTGGNGIDDDPTDDDKDDLELWQRIGAIGEGCGMDWAGRWVTFKEYPHFQFRGEK